MKKENEFNLKGYFLFFLIASLYLVLVYFIFDQFDIPSEVNGISIKSIDYGVRYALEIIFNNTKNFLQYILLFPIVPLLILYELFMMSFQTWISINNVGGFETFQLLYKHGIIELPNMFLYMFLSLNCCIIFFKNFSIIDVIDFIKQNKKTYVFSYMLICISGIIEGMIG
ncbi:hypothetical protein [Enterococcus faecalis]|uniref:hypothetical protein n=1 Tax=Enterococcus faecalis TaxID=1351 RepID=UPI001A09F867|nr:hypothetical protein [Enterococcus faecalis]